MKKPLILIIFIIAVMAGLGVTQVAVSNKLSTTGIELESLQNQLEKYKKENTSLEEKVLQASSLQNLAKQAKAIGFVAGQSKIYLSNPLPLALKSF